MKSLAKLLLLLLLTSSLYCPTFAASTQVGSTEATDTEDILGEQVNEMSYSDIEEMLGNSNNSHADNHFVVVNEENIDKELSESKTAINHTGLMVIGIILASAPLLLIVTAILFCLVLAYEKYQKKHSHGVRGRT